MDNCYGAVLFFGDSLNFQEAGSWNRPSVCTCVERLGFTADEFSFGVIDADFGVAIVVIELDDDVAFARFGVYDVDFSRGVFARADDQVLIECCNVFFRRASDNQWVVMSGGGGLKFTIEQDFFVVVPVFHPESDHLPVVFRDFRQAYGDLWHAEEDVEDL